MATLTSFFIKHNKVNQKTGNAMKKAGMLGSFFSYLDNVPSATEEVALVNKNREGSWGTFFAGAPSKYSVTRVKGDLYSIVWIRPKGRSNSYSDKEGAKEIVRTLKVHCDTDPMAYLQDIVNQAQPLEIKI